MVLAQLPGDFDCNGVVNGVDLVYLTDRLHSGLIDTESCTWSNGDLNSDSIFHTVADWLQLNMYIHIYQPGDNPPQPGELDSIFIADIWAYPGDTVCVPISIKAVDPFMGVSIQLQFNTSLLVSPMIRDLLYDNEFYPAIAYGDKLYWWKFAVLDTIYAPGQHHVGDVGFIVSEHAPLDTVLELELIGGDYYPSGLANNSYPTYFIRPILVNGHIHIGTSGIGEDPVPKVYEFKLANYPNPFNSSTLIELSLANESKINIEIFNILGQKVCQLFDGRLPAGYHRLFWNAHNFSSGVYFVRMNDGENTKSIKLTLLR